MFGKTDRSLVKGFLRAQGNRIVNGENEEIVLTGWGLGNWLLSEGYMWSTHHERFDRPRRIEAVIRELTGEAYAETFWTTFRERYISREDIRQMAEQGYNSVRIPFNWRVLMEEGPDIVWIEKGFALIDRCLDWCEEFGLYAFLDLHGAPGGQTGANIDDSLDDRPRLFTDADSRRKAIELWKELARRYRERWIVGGYDLLNEPLRPGLVPDGHEYPLVQKLVEFYDETVAAIRAIDERHMLSIEGHHWATDPAIFYKRYDRNMVIHFHRYACMPGAEAYETYLKLSQRLDQPLWLGETGENLPEWYAAMYPLAVSLGIGYNLWPWKKMDCDNSPYSIGRPEGWSELIAYLEGGAHPGYERMHEIFDDYLERIVTANCRCNPAVSASVFRRPGCVVRGTDFDEQPGRGLSFSGLRQEGNLYGYRAGTGMEIVPLTDDPPPKRFVFDCGWDFLGLALEKEEFAVYTFTSVGHGMYAEIVCEAVEGEAEIEIEQDGSGAVKHRIGGGGGTQVCIAELQEAFETKLKLRAAHGRLIVHTVAVREGDR